MGVQLQQPKKTPFFSRQVVRDDLEVRVIKTLNFFFFLKRHHIPHKLEEFKCKCQLSGVYVLKQFMIPPTHVFAVLHPISVSDGKKSKFIGKQF